MSSFGKKGRALVVGLSLIFGVAAAPGAQAQSADNNANLSSFFDNKPAATEVSDTTIVADADASRFITTNADSTGSPTVNTGQQHNLTVTPTDVTVHRGNGNNGHTPQANNGGGDTKVTERVTTNNRVNVNQRGVYGQYGVNKTVTTRNDDTRTRTNTRTQVRRHTNGDISVNNRRSSTVQTENVRVRTNTQVQRTRNGQIRTAGGVEIRTGDRGNQTRFQIKKDRRGNLSFQIGKRTTRTTTYRR